jgi:hypothetical protein
MRRLARGLEIAGDQSQIGALAREGACSRLSDAATSTRDDGDFTGKL